MVPSSAWFFWRSGGVRDHRRRQVGGADPASRGRGDRAAGPLQQDRVGSADAAAAVHRPDPRPGGPARAGGVVPAAAGDHRGQPDGEHRHRGVLPGHQPAGRRVPDQQLHRRRRAADHHHAAQRGRRHDARADADLARPDQRPTARRARRGHRPVGAASGPRRVAQHRPAAVDSGLDGKADEGRPREARDDPDRGRQPRGVDQAGRGPEAGADPGGRGRQAGRDPCRGGRSAVPDAARPGRAGRAYLQAQGQAKAIEKTFAAIKAGRPTPEMLAYQYLQTLPQMAKGEANKVWVVPSDFGSALQGFTKMLGAPGEDGVFRYQPSPVDENLPKPEDDSDEVADWFNTRPTRRSRRRSPRPWRTRDRRRAWALSGRLPRTHCHRCSTRRCRSSSRTIRRSRRVATAVNWAVSAVGG